MSAILVVIVRACGSPYRAEVDLPPSPLCEKCGHELCVCCGTWCDTIVNGDVCECFERDCEVDPEAARAWLAECERRRSLTCFGEDGIE